MSKSSFWTQVAEHGFHDGRAHANEELPYREGLLAIFVHGWWGDYKTTWGELPAKVLAQSGQSIDCLSFGYSTSLLSQVTNERVAAGLLALLTRIDETFHAFHGRTYSHYVFITHSNGGLVVKEALAQDISAVDTELIETGKPFRQIEGKSMSLRTRRIANIAVPHLGGNPLLTGPLRALARLFGGRNEIASQLGWQSEWSANLHGRFERLMASQKALALPIPELHEILAKGDLAVLDEGAGGFRRSAEEGENFVYHAKTSEFVSQYGKRKPRTFEGTHSSVKLPGSRRRRIGSMLWSRKFAEEDGALVSHLSKIVSVPTGPTEILCLGMIRDTMQWIEHSSELKHMRALTSLKATGNVDHLDGCKPGSQYQVLQKLNAALAKSGSEARRLTVTGQEGSGKTIVILSLARQLAILALSDEDDSNPIPLYFPLQFSGADMDDANSLIEELIRGYVKWVNNFVGGSQLTFDVIANLLRSRPTVIHIDGVDEFLRLNPAVRFETLVGRMKELQRDGTSLHRESTILLGVRATQIGLLEFSSERFRYEVSLIDQEQAISIFPALRELIDKADPRARRLLQVPLFLTRLASAEEDNLDSDGFRGLTAGVTPRILYERILRSLWDRQDASEHDSGVLRSGGEMQKLRDTFSTFERWKNALCAVSWIFFEAREDLLEERNVKKGINQLRKTWHVIQERARSNSPARTWTETDRLAALSVIDSVTVSLTLLVEEPQALGLLLDTGVTTRFKSETATAIRFHHDRWLVYMIGCYLATSAKAYNLAPLIQRGFRASIFEIAGDLLTLPSDLLGGTFQVTSGLVDEADASVQAAREAGNPGRELYANFCALIGNSMAAVGLTEAQRLTQASEHDFDVLRAVQLWSLSYRAIKSLKDPQDSDLRENLAEALVEELNCSSHIRRSAAWCYLKLLAPNIVEGKERPMFNSSTKEDWERQLLPSSVGFFVWDRANGKAKRPEPGESALQAGLLEMTGAIQTDPPRTISVLHYLAFLNLACALGGNETGIRARLESFFKRGGRDHARLIECAEKISLPELGDVYLEMGELLRTKFSK